MKHLLLFCGLGLALWSRPVQAAPRLVAPPDTVAGHAHMIRLLSANLCSALEAESKTTNFQTLSTYQSDRLLQGMVMKIIGQNLATFQRLQNAIPKRQQKAYAQQMGREALLRMADTCPTAPRFLADLNVESMQDKAPISAAERAVLLPIAQSACQRIGDEDKQQPLESRSAADSKAAITQALQATFLISAPELMQYYGDDVMTNQQRIGVVAERMALVMFEFCPKYLLMLSIHPAVK